jgi:DNA segregation ATPase FtsK/SpoIIIE-like protein
VLDRKRLQVQELIAARRIVLLDRDPYPGACAELARAQSPRLWQREPGDLDFLFARVGIGRQDSAVRAPAPFVLQQDDPLREQIEALEQFAAVVSNVPVGPRLHRAHSLQITGERDIVLETARALVVQLATHHAPEVLRISALFAPEDSAQWAWLRWLPHVWSVDGARRCMASDTADADRLCESLADAGPVQVMIVADARLVSRDVADDVRLVWLGDARGDVDLRLELQAEERRATLFDGERVALRVDRVDEASVEAAERFARLLAPLRAAEVDALDDIVRVRLDGSREVLVSAPSEVLT